MGAGEREEEARRAYDAVAGTYAATVPERFAQDVRGRSMVAAFAELVARGGAGPVADLGCGPGHVTAFLQTLGVPAYGVDISALTVAGARRAHPRLRFEVGSLAALDAADGSLGGVLSWWSLLHTPPVERPAVFGEWHRALAPGGYVLLGFHVGEGQSQVRAAYGHEDVDYVIELIRPEELIAELAVAGFAREALLLLPGVRREQACLLVRKA
ncbi:class I SAM-dependent methyltransferase [Streptacidiphilus jiangxiensis]|uniref:Methyltransferase domain-containing protein n=1 Tax=Streptacidiphilus jiangxiensis TaxID=235985 RepID=A0A1H7UQE9_STRJI|nr:class I SAM-dependent methyltransferase [Streptacidiphilus jiangxiensis]SEL98858.1 Methyltransferase domain-containing protein [Streptacidiphilus jiangxiensis]